MLKPCWLLQFIDTFVDIAARGNLSFAHFGCNRGTSLVLVLMSIIFLRFVSVYITICCFIYFISCHFAILYPCTLLQVFFSFEPGVFSEITSLPRKVRDKVCIHQTLPIPHLCDYTRYVFIVFLQKKKSSSFIFVSVLYWTNYYNYHFQKKIILD